mgnify:CR=1 FL=1
MEKRITTPPDNISLYAKGQMESFPDEHPTIVPLFKIDVLMALEPYLWEIVTTDHTTPTRNRVKSYGMPTMCSNVN